MLSSSDSTSGEGTISHEIIKHLPERAKEYLRIISKIWETGIMTKSLKITIIVLVKKPNQDAFQATSYRPIALTSCVCKLMEKMINTLLVWHFEMNAFNISFLIWVSKVLGVVWIFC